MFQLWEAIVVILTSLGLSNVSIINIIVFQFKSQINNVLGELLIYYLEG